MLKTQKTGQAVRAGPVFREARQTQRSSVLYSPQETVHSAADTALKLQAILV